MSNARTFTNSFAGVEGVLKEFKAIGEIFVAEDIDIRIRDHEQSGIAMLHTSIQTGSQAANFRIELFVVQRDDIDLHQEEPSEVRWTCNLTLSYRHDRCAFLQCAYTDHLDCKYLCGDMRSGKYSNYIEKRLNIIRARDGAYENPDTIYFRRHRHASSLLKDRQTFLATAHEMIKIYKEQPTAIY